MAPAPLSLPPLPAVVAPSTDVHEQHEPYDPFDDELHPPLIDDDDISLLREPTVERSRLPPLDDDEDDGDGIGGDLRLFSDRAHE